MWDMQKEISKNVEFEWWRENKYDRLFDFEFRRVNKKLELCDAIDYTIRDNSISRTKSI